MAKRKPTIWLINDYKLGRDSWWFQLGIPATLNFPEYFSLEAKENKTPLEIEQREKIADKIIGIIHLYRNHQILPAEILPHTMYADFQVLYAAFPRENLALIPSVFAVSDKYIMITEPLLRVLQNFRLGSTQISPVRLREQTTHELLSEQTYYFINVCERYNFLSPKDSDQSLKPITIGESNIYFRPNSRDEAKLFCFSRQALDCPVDIWHDPLMTYSVFLSDPLYQAIHAAGLDKDISLFSCHLV